MSQLMGNKRSALIETLERRVFMDGSSPFSPSFNAGADDPIHFEATGDFNNDGRPDIVMRNQETGSNQVLLLTQNTEGGGGFTGNVVAIKTAASTNWWIASVNDFDSDGKKDDILLRNYADGRNVIWFMEGTVFQSATEIQSAANTQWVIGATGDFNHDTKADIVLRNYTTGQNIVWFMDGAMRIGSAQLLTAANTQWQLSGAADFNNDTKPDLVFRNFSTGDDVTWLMNDTSRISSVLLPRAANLQWEINALGDFNNDGDPDIVLRNYQLIGNNAVVWFMTDTTRIGGDVLPPFNG
jgi:hypothetical protein